MAQQLPISLYIRVLTFRIRRLNAAPFNLFFLEIYDDANDVCYTCEQITNASRFDPPVGNIGSSARKQPQARHNLSSTCLYNTDKTAYDNAMAHAKIVV